jgi:hypothetical protein
MKAIAIGADEAAYSLKQTLIDFLREQGDEVRGLRRLLKGLGGLPRHGGGGSRGRSKMRARARS